jgi:hypothetical protein
MKSMRVSVERTAETSGPEAEGIILAISNFLCHASGANRAFADHQYRIDKLILQRTTPLQRVDGIDRVKTRIEETGAHDDRITG